MKRIVIYTVIIFMAWASSAYTEEMSSKRDCVMCHIMWMDDFRTEKETLVQWQPGNVLMKDTQGVVSSEDVCYSCHDGYVQDSRYVTWKFNRHPVFVKPSGNVTIPDDLPLSVDGEIYCGTCHSAHGKGAASHDDPTGRTKVFREPNVDSHLCEKCHRDEEAYRFSNSHPVNTSERELPDLLFRFGSKRAVDSNEIICQTCHRVHGAKGDRILIIENENSGLCTICHEAQRTVIDTKHDLRVSLPGVKNIKERTTEESGPCGACHTPHNAAGEKLWARSSKQGNPASQVCLSCHGDDSGYDIKRTGIYSHPLDVKIPSDKSPSDMLPLFTGDGRREAGGRIECFTCHDIHRWDPRSASNTGGRGVEGDATNSFLRMANTASAMCMECHSEKRKVVESDHNLTVTAPDEKNAAGATAAVAGPCGACHIPHNAEAKHLWAKKPFGNRDFVTQLCTACHNKEGAAKAKLIGENYHPVDVTLERSHISTDLPLFDRDGNRKAEGRMVCITCHDPHTWDPDGGDASYAGENIEGDATNSFLRMTNFPASDLCTSCHADKAFIDGTDHDLNVTAPESQNILGQTVKESGQCGVCHLVHNSPNGLKLWARPYGEIPEGENVINSLCFSCHAEGRVAEKKIPVVASHPEDKIISNIFRNDRKNIDFSPLFDKETGQETEFGNISCPTCHDAHQWNPLLEQRGKHENLEGNATNSFLRNVSYNNICIDCHGFDALFRFKYFHDPDHRVEEKSY